MEDNYKKIFLRYSDPNKNILSEDKNALKKFQIVENIDSVRGKNILEIGAGASSHCKLFLDNGCNSYIANDIIEKRLELLPEDKRITKICGDFLELNLIENVDIIFSSLTMMILVQQHKKIINKIHDFLKVGGVFIGYEANYICPLSLWRLLYQKGPSNPAIFFNPFEYSKIFKDVGFEVNALKPILRSKNMHFLWPLGTSFMIKATKI